MTYKSLHQIKSFRLLTQRYIEQKNLLSLLEAYHYTYYNPNWYNKCKTIIKLKTLIKPQPNNTPFITIQYYREKMDIQRSILAMLMALSITVCQAQMQIDTTTSHNDLIEKILLGGNNVKVGNIKYTGHKSAIGAFEVDKDNPLGISKGLFLSTGNANAIGGENTLPNRTDLMDYKGDKDLDQLCANETFDAAFIEFDFVPLSNKVSFEYIFASEEFLEFTGSKYNDVFAFFISGPAIEGKKNIAVLKKTKEIISINTINQYKNSDSFINNNPWKLNGKLESEEKLIHLDKQLLKTTEFDGMTVVLTAETNVVPFKKYHFKIAIADVSDMKYNSAVFLKGGSFKIEKDSTASEEFQISENINTDLIDVDAILNNQPFDLKTAIVKVEKTPTLPHNEIPEPEENIEEATFSASKAITNPVLTASNVTSPTISPFQNILFPHNSTSLSNEVKSNLDDLIVVLTTNSTSKIQLKGHANSIGNALYNLKLSENRVKSVCDYLISKGVSKEQIELEFHGENQPIADNQNEIGRAKNRRVEIILHKL